MSLQRPCLCQQDGSLRPRRPSLGEAEAFMLNYPCPEANLWIIFLQEKLTDLALPCHVSGMEKPLALGISGKPQGLQVTITISTGESER